MFKEGTDANNALEMFKLDADTIRGYINDPSIGYSQVERILDSAHSIRYQVPRVIGEKRESQDEQRKEYWRYLIRKKKIGVF